MQPHRRPEVDLDDERRGDHHKAHQHDHEYGRTVARIFGRQVETAMAANRRYSQVAGKQLAPAAARATAAQAGQNR